MKKADDERASIEAAIKEKMRNEQPLTMDQFEKMLDKTIEVDTNDYKIDETIRKTEIIKFRNSSNSKKNNKK